jgi:dCMP deaminase
MLSLEELNNHFKTLPDWDHYFLSFIPLVKSRSKDKHTQVGCVVVNEFNNIVMTGYNSLAAGINDHVPERYERPEKYDWMVHSEENAICAAAKAGIRLYGTRMYQPGLPCMTCARMIIQAGIKEIIYSKEQLALWNSPKYDATMLNKSKQMLFEAQIKVRGV